MPKEQINTINMTELRDYTKMTNAVDIIGCIKYEESKLLYRGYDNKDLCIFMSRDVRDTLGELYGYIYDPKSKMSYFMGYPTYFIKGKHLIYMGVRCKGVDEWLKKNK